MPTEISARPQGAPRPGARGHEKRDASVGWIAGVVLFMIICGFAIQSSLVGLVKGLKKTAAPTDSWNRVQPVMNSDSRVSQFPKLQVSAPEDLAAFRAREETELSSYGWVNQTAGIVHVPIERAMDLVLQKGLPTRSGNGPAATGPSTLQLQQQRPGQRDSDNGGQR